MNTKETEEDVLINEYIGLIDMGISKADEIIKRLEAFKTDYDDEENLKIIKRRMDGVVRVAHELDITQDSLHWME